MLIDHANGNLDPFYLEADRDTKAPFAASRKIASRIKATAFETGMLCYPMSGTMDWQ